MRQAVRESRESREYPPGLRGAMGVCDEWGGAESHGNGVRPVE